MASLPKGLKNIFQNYSTKRRVFDEIKIPDESWRIIFLFSTESSIYGLVNFEISYQSPPKNKFLDCGRD